MAASERSTGDPEGTDVLLVEDHQVIARLTVRHLELAGCTVTHASTGGGALEACARQRFALVLLDHGLPDLDGTETTRRLRALPGGQDLHIVWLTGDPTLVDHPQSAAADAVAAKPLSGEGLRDLVARWAGRSARSI